MQRIPRTMRRGAAALSFLAAALLAPGRASSQTTAPVEVRQYKALVDKLAAPEMEGRGPETRGLVKARDLLVDRFRGIGLRPAFGESCLQGFQVPGGAKAEKEELAIEGSREPLKAGVDFTAMGLSANKAFAGEAVFVGYSIVDPGRKHDSYAGAAGDALKGKVAVVLRYEPHDAQGVSRWTKRKGAWSRAAGLAAKVAHAARRGAAAVLIVNPPAVDTAALDALRRTSYRSRRQVPVLHITRKAWRAILRAAGKDAPAVARATEADADAGKGAVFPLGVTVRGEVRLTATRTTVHNVAAVLPGAGTLAEQYVVIGAHYDHVGYGYFGSRVRLKAPTVHPGADDNASGTAGVVTLARWFAARAARPDAPASRRSMIFLAFAAEEMGLLGSRHFVAHLYEAGLQREQVTAMLNMDMIGRLREGRLSVWGVDSGDRWREIIRDANKPESLTLRLSGSGLGPSDHASFYRAKVPVIVLNTGMHADLHAPTDTPDKINAAGAIDVLRFGESVLAAVWADERPVAYVGPKGEGRKRAFLGIAFDADHEGPGCKVSSVLSGGPAEQAGLADGDLITKLNDKPVAGSSDLMILLRHCAPDETVTLTVRRAGKTVQMKVKLGGR